MNKREKIIETKPEPEYETKDWDDCKKENEDKPNTLGTSSHNGRNESNAGTHVNNLRSKLKNSYINFCKRLQILQFINIKAYM